MVGLVRPTILIPQSMDERQGPEEHLRLTLLHEIAHAEQSDPRFGTMATLAQAVWFFLPPIWWLRSQLLLDQEFMADRLAAFDYGTKSNYAASLLRLLESRTKHRAEGSLRKSDRTWPTGEEIRSPLFQRLLMLLQCPYHVEARTPWPWSGALRLAVIGAAIAASCLFVRWPDLTSRELRLAEMARNKSRSFRVANMVSEPLVISRGSRSLAYLLPLILPSSFELTVDVQAGRDELPQIRIAGNSLASSVPSSNLSVAARHFSHDPRTWHDVRLVRTAGRLSLWVDGQSVPVDRSGEKTNEWLTIEPGPDREVQFRNLVVTW